MLLRTIGRAARSFAAAGLIFVLGAVAAWATPYLVVDAGSGKTLIENQATVPWYPASLTKLMTTYVALDAVRQGRLTMDTPLTMSLRAARMQPSKMGFAPGVEVTLDNALKMLMVKSPNDVAVMVAEGVSGSVEAFADEMNATAHKLGMQESHFVNPNGLHDPEHVSSARDMAIVARALLADFPEHADLYGIGALQLGKEIIPNHNGLIGHYPGADGMKTGFTCPAGFNVVASAVHNGRKLIVVVLGSPSPHERNLEAAELFERGFALTGDGGPQPADLPRSSQTTPRDMRGEICARRNAAAMAAADEEETFGAPAAAGESRGRASGAAAVATAAPSVSPEELLSRQPVHFDPVPVFVGPIPGWSGPVLAARPTPVTPSEASAYTTASAPSPATAAGDSAPMALQGAVKPPAPIVSHAPEKKPVRLAWRHLRTRPAPAQRQKTPAKASN